ncbi:MAG: hypothetical protein IPG02_07140 [Ignavibacteria bacterium]|jgi:hypothetical protein|nr:hypothetical protein [Ignavibacteria bacterium]MBK6878380.1 hypothetical protein [Ignavibacteria bacterium]MBK9227890.1 hypothetical protein [Ignavibacteria bacterium]
MPKIIFEINYNINPENREGYLATVGELKAKIIETGIDYSIFESKKSPNNFTEMYTCKNEDEYESLEDNQSEETVELTQKLFDEYIQNNKVTYTTKYEI